MEAKDKTVYLEGLAFISTVFNESGALTPFLESLVKQTALPSEIILVDGGSGDDTLDVIKDFFKGLQKNPGFKTTTIIDSCRDNSLTQAQEAAVGSFVPPGLKKTGSHTAAFGSDADNNSVSLPVSGCNTAAQGAVPPGSDSCNEGKNKSCNIDYIGEKLVFESIINGIVRVKIYSAPGANISTGRNIAIKNANSEFICASDAGCRLSGDWVEEISKYFFGAHKGKAADDGTEGVEPHFDTCLASSSHGPVSPLAGVPERESSPQGTNSLADGGIINKPGAYNSANFGTGHDIVSGGYNFPYIENFLQGCLAVCVLPVKNEIAGGKYMPSSRNIGFAKAAWEKAKGYPQNMDFGEDMRFNFNLKAFGCRVIFNPDALVYWNLRSSLSAIFRQFFRYAKGDAVGRMYTHRHLIRFASVLVFATLILAAALISPWILLAILLLFAAFIYKPYFRIKYFLNDKKCSVFAESKKNLLIVKIKTIFCIPLMLPFIETAKLAGYIYGLFIRKNK